MANSSTKGILRGKTIADKTVSGVFAMAGTFLLMVTIAVASESLFSFQVKPLIMMGLSGGAFLVCISLRRVGDAIVINPLNRMIALWLDTIRGIHPRHASRINWPVRLLAGTWFAYAVLHVLNWFHRGAWLGLVEPQYYQEAIGQLAWPVSIHLPVILTGLVVVPSMARQTQRIWLVLVIASICMLAFRIVYLIAPGVRSKMLRAENFPFFKQDVVHCTFELTLFASMMILLIVFRRSFSDPFEEEGLTEPSLPESVLMKRRLILFGLLALQVPVLVIGVILFSEIKPTGYVSTRLYFRYSTPLEDNKNWGFLAANVPKEILRSAAATKEFIRLEHLCRGYLDNWKWMCRNAICNAMTNDQEDLFDFYIENDLDLIACEFHKREHFLFVGPMNADVKYWKQLYDRHRPTFDERHWSRIMSLTFRYNNVELLCYLVDEQGLDPNMKTDRGQPLLGIWLDRLQRQDTTALDVLLNRGLDLNATDAYGSTVLDYHHDEHSALLFKEWWIEALRERGAKRGSEL